MADYSKRWAHKISSPDSTDSCTLGNRTDRRTDRFEAVYS